MNQDGDAGAGHEALGKGDGDDLRRRQSVERLGINGIVVTASSTGSHGEDDRSTKTSRMGGLLRAPSTPRARCAGPISSLSVHPMSAPFVPQRAGTGREARVAVVKRTGSDRPLRPITRA